MIYSVVDKSMASTEERKERNTFLLRSNFFLETIVTYYIIDKYKLAN